MMKNHYALPEGNVAIAFSGGRSSAYMLFHILEANGGIPDRAVVSFQNTGREFDETLDFVQECASRWGVRVVWLEWRDINIHGVRWEVVSHNSASRNGEPFAELIRKRKMAPNRVARFCTAELKVHTCTRYLRSIGWDRWHSARGIRSDEPRRLNRKPPRERWTPWHPLADAKVTKEDVAAFWEKQPFDLKLKNDNGKTPQGNCDFCFLKSEENLVHTGVDHMERALWWAGMEEELASDKSIPRKKTVFSNKRRYIDIVLTAVMEDPKKLETEGYLCQANDGECF